MSVAVKTKTRLKTVKSLNSIFNALQVITMARLQKVRQKHTSAKLYLERLQQAAQNLDLSSFAQPREEGKTIALLISPNRGLCGAFNQNLLYRAQNFIKESDRPKEFIAFGRKGGEFLRSRKQIVVDSYLKEDYHFDFFAGLANKMITDYQNGKLARISLIFNRFQTLMRQDAVVRELLPAESLPGQDPDRFIIEPDKFLAAAKVFEQMLAVELYYAYLDSQLGELSARMFTLKGAIENSKEIMQELAMNLNKARQQMITRDLLEIIASSECLNEGECY